MICQNAIRTKADDCWNLFQYEKDEAARTVQLRKILVISVEKKASNNGSEQQEM